MTIEILAFFYVSLLNKWKKKCIFLDKMGSERTFSNTGLRVAGVSFLGNRVSTIFIWNRFSLFWKSISNSYLKYDFCLRYCFRCFIFILCFNRQKTLIYQLFFFIHGNPPFRIEKVKELLPIFNNPMLFLLWTSLLWCPINVSKHFAPSASPETVECSCWAWF